MSERERARARALEQIRHARNAGPTPDVWAASLVAGDRDALARAITLVESRLASDRPATHALLQAVLAAAPDAAARALRIGITGVPGAGKSTLIERWGAEWAEAGYRVAVLAVDPSSVRSRGSLLGDKTRMEGLVQRGDIFVRPSPAADTLGGVARATREAIFLCEAAGFDLILVETVGVGQNETAVRALTDVFLLLALSGTGDDLQGIKRGIMELADLVFVNKSDRGGEAAAERAASMLSAALHLLPTPPSGSAVPVLAGSGLEGHGLDRLRAAVVELAEHWRASGFFARQRALQTSEAFEDHVRTLVFDEARMRLDGDRRFERLQTEVARGQISAYSAAWEYVHGA
jgi:LAO/AO transport system kinase